MKITTLLFAMTMLFGSGTSYEKLTPELRRSTIDSLAKALKEEYVLPDIAEKAIQKIQSKLAEKGYDALDSGQDFAKALTEDLNSVCKDAHLRVRYSEEVLPARKEASTPSQEELKRYAREQTLANNGFEEVRRLQGNVGYLKTVYFAEGSEMSRACKAAFDFLANTDALIIDMRQNGGGSPDGVRHLCSYLFDDKPVHLNDIYFRQGNRTESFWTLKKVPGKRYGTTKPVYILVSKRTGSGAEEFAYDLQNLKRAPIIGENTWGGANPGGVVRLNDHFGAFIPVGRAINPYTKTNWEGTGVTPDIKVNPQDALSFVHKLAIKDLLSKAKDAEDRERLGQVLKELGG